MLTDVTPARQTRGLQVPGSPAVTLLSASWQLPTSLSSQTLSSPPRLLLGRWPSSSSSGNAKALRRPPPAPLWGLFLQHRGSWTPHSVLFVGGQLFTASMTPSSRSKEAPPSLVPRMPLLPPLWQHTVSLREIHTALRPVGPAPGGGC